VRAERSASDFDALTFDCYGTLVDWLGGVRAAIAARPGLAGADLDRLVRDRDAIDRELVLAPYRPYGEILRESLRRAAELQGRRLGPGEADAFAASMPRWPPFEETPGVLRRLARRYRLAILSNVETATLSASVRALGAPIELCVTAEELRSYKPARAHFDEALQRLALPRERVLHVACSLFHDVRPAVALGWNAAWINREGEAVPRDLECVLVVPDLASLERALAPAR
jgi:2-haloalkanoic acid dehalogenase type II